MSRKATRAEIADLLTANLADLLSKKAGTQDPAVYRGQVATFGKARAAVVVSSNGTVPQIIASRNLIGKYQIALDIFVLYADPDESWDEEKAEDLLDDIVDKILDVLKENQKGKNWNALDWTEPSIPDPKEVGGVEYRHEQIILYPS